MNMLKNFTRGLKIGLVGSVCALALAGAAMADTRNFDVPAGDLKKGLDTYIQQSGIQLIYRADDVKGVKTRGVSGALSTEDALSQLLAGSGFTVTRDPTGAVVVAKSPQFEAGGKGGSAASETQASDSSSDLVIIGIRSSLKKSQDVKKAANANIDVVTAEDVGKFPDINVAESLARLPGLAVDRAGGEGEKLSIMGVDSRLNVISLNNHPMATADYGGSNSTGAGRSFNYSLLAPELIGSAEVYKSYEARLDEGSIGGSIIIHTRKPLDLPANTLTASAGFAENLRTKNGDGKASILYSWRNRDKTLGVLASASYNNYSIGGTSISVFDYQTGCDFANLYFWPEGTLDWRQPYGTCVNGKFVDPTKLPAVSNGGPALSETMKIPGSINQGSFIQDRKRTTYSLAAQWRPTEDLEFGFEALMIDGDYSSLSRSMQTDVGVYWNGSAKYGTLETNGSNVIGGKATSLPIRQDLYYKKSDLSNETYDFTAKWTPGDWVIKVNAGTSLATGGSNPEYYLDFKGNVGATWRIQDQETYVKFDQPLDTPNLLRSNTGMTGFIDQIPFKDRITYAGIDFKKQIELGIFTDVLFGYKRSNHVNSKTYFEHQIDTGTTGLYLDQLDTFQTPTSWARDLGGSGDILTYRTATLDSFLAYVNAHRGTQDRNFNWNNFYGSELLNAAYIQGNFEYDKWRGNVGLRYTQSESAQTSLKEDGTPAFVANANYIGYAPGEGITTIKTKGSNVLPALNLVYELRDDILLRFNTAKVIARPSFDQMSSEIKIDYSTKQASGGNPYLKPYEATNYGASAEWYFKSNSYLAFDVFYRDIGSYIVTKISQQTFPTSDAYLASHPGFPTSQTFQLNAPYNANNAKVKGLAVNLQTDLVYGFGLVTNLTYTDYQTEPYSDALNTGTYKMYMPYLSKYLFNFAPYYEHGPWQARLAYSYRTKYLTTVALDKGTGNNWTPQREQLDFSGSYQINSRFGLTVTASNLLDNLQIPYRDTPSNPLSWTRNGTVATVTLNYKM